MGLNRIPLMGRSPRAASMEGPAVHTPLEICTAIEQLLETWATARAQNVDWQHRNIEDLHCQDNISAPFIARLIQDYFAILPLDSSRSGRFLIAIRGYWEEMCELHLQCIACLLQPHKTRLNSQLPLLIQRALYHHAMMAKWRWLRHQAIPPYLWARLHKFYAVAERHGFEHLPLPLPGNPGAKSHCEALYLRPQLLHILRPDTLLACEMEQADQWIARWNNSVLLEKALPVEKHGYGINLESANPPRPVALMERSGNFRYWNPGLLVAALQAESGPDERGQASWKLDLWSRVVNGWSGMSSLHRHPRQRIEKRAEFFRGFEEIHAKAGQPLMTEPDAPYCRVRDASPEGACIVLKTVDSMQITIHTLIGIRSERQLQVGTVCRMRRHESGWTEIGVRQMTANPVPVKMESASGNPGEQIDALYLSMEGRFRKRQYVLASAMMSPGGIQWRLLRQGRPYLIQLGPPLQRTPDYLLAGIDRLIQAEQAPC